MINTTQITKRVVMQQENTNHAMKTGNAKVSQASTGMTVTGVMTVNFTTVAPTITASIQLIPLSLNSLNASERHL